jgi:hypothetical protein
MAVNVNHITHQNIPQSNTTTKSSVVNQQTNEVRPNSAAIQISDTAQQKSPTSNTVNKSPEMNPQSN